MRILLGILLLFTSCGSSSKEETVQGEYIFRLHDEEFLHIQPLKPKAPPQYPWQTGSQNSLCRITKEYLRCKGSPLNLPRIVKEGDKESARYTDCGGPDKHSLPLKNGKESIYPILLELLNRIQEITKRPVVITSGHRCPDHNTYIDPSPQNSASKHMIGAEVDFYIQGLETHPEVAIKIIQDFYKTDSRYQKQKDYLEFKRFEKLTNSSTAPWYNKEIFIKLFKAHEGRNLDNRHSHPYISLQVRFDKEKNLAVTFSWEQAQQFLRK
ncbi:MAG: hypothetical protein JWO53_271 [Chlamydiia bacterium]|nr:hypothetical protein [Chlamydiia bacterium]